MAEIIIVGSGASAAAAAWELRDRELLIMDAGLTPPESPRIRGRLFDLRRSDPDQAVYLLGKDFESLVNIHGEDLVSLKLKAPLVEYVIRRIPGIAPVETEGFVPFISYARGGLANAWGAGVFRYTDADLAGFPISAADLQPFYEELTDHIGISGANDDLEPFFGAIRGLQPPLRFNRNCGRFYRIYQRRRKRLSRRGITVGHSHLAHLTREMDGRPACRGENTSFFTTSNPCIYTPRITLEKLRERDNVTYLPGWVVERFTPREGGVEVEARSLEDGAVRRFRGRHLLLGAGAVNTGRIVLQSFNDRNTRMPILDNPISFIPFVNLPGMGSPTDMDGYEGGQLILIYDGPRHPGRVQGSIYSYITPLRADTFFDFPFSLRGNLALTRCVVPAMTILQLFYPDMPRPGNYIQLLEDRRLLIRYTDRPRLGRVERFLIRTFLPWGFVTLPQLVQYPKPGNSIHYAGTVPMERRDLPYHTDRDGRLNRAPRVRLVDGAVFPLLPAKNLTLTLMANAMRTARALKAEG